MLEQRRAELRNDLAQASTLDELDDLVVQHRERMFAGLPVGLALGDFVDRFNADAASMRAELAHELGADDDADGQAGT